MVTIYQNKHNVGHNAPVKLLLLSETLIKTRFHIGTVYA